MFKTFSPAAQHAILVIIAALLGWAGPNLQAISGVPPVIASLLGALIAWFVGYVAPPISSYGLTGRKGAHASETVPETTPEV